MKNIKQISLMDKGIPVRKDSYAKAVRYTKRLLSTSEYFHDSIKTDNPLYDLSSDFTPERNFAVCSSWARRKGYGQLYGETYWD